MHPRHITHKIKNALSDTPVVLINGARQTGKSTLAKALADKHYSAAYLTLDNTATLNAAISDPIQFIENLPNHVILDEIQRAPHLFLAIKESVDKNRAPGRFLLTGSANVLLLPTLSDSLAGRMEIVLLWPLSQGEIHDTKEFFIDKIFSKKLIFKNTNTLKRSELIHRVLQGGYPEILSRPSLERREAWFESYITTLLQRDVRDIANIEGLTQLPRLLSLLATRTGCLVNLTDVSRICGIPSTTLNRYITLLKTIFLIYFLPPWSNNRSKRLVKSPKLYFCDSGLNAYLSGITEARLQRESDIFGLLFENFVLNELKKQIGWNSTRCEIFHYRTNTGYEVDFILENKEGSIIGIEVKANSTLSEKNFKGLFHLSEEFQDQFIRGIVVYTGTQVLSYGKNIVAIPVDMIWQ